MRDFLQLLFVKFLFSKGEWLIMCLFFAQRVILGKTAFSDVPAALRPGVAEALIDSGLPDLVPEEYR